MRRQTKQLERTALTKLASVKLAAIAVSLLFSSQNATANDLAVGAAESMNFKPAAVTSQTISPNATPSDILSATTVKPYQAPTAVPGQIPGVVAGKPLVFQRSKTATKSSAKKDDSQNQMMQQLGQAVGGGSGNGNPSKSPGASPSQYADNSKTEAGFCYECQYGSHKGPEGQGLSDAALASANTGNDCMNKLLNSMRTVSQQMSPSRGRCGTAVRTGLENAGFLPKGSYIAQGAKDFGTGDSSSSQSLEKIGFQNIKATHPEMTPETAPEGAILVYGSADQSRARFGCRGKGSTWGHIEVKDFGGQYLYDGKANRNIQRIFSEPCRPLKGVYIPGPNMRSCNGKGVGV